MSFVFLHSVSDVLITANRIRTVCIAEECTSVIFDLSELISALLGFFFHISISLLLILFIFKVLIKLKFVFSAWADKLTVK